MNESEFDVVVIGGGSTGTAVARDCAMRGFRTLLLERDDIASGTSGANAGMISSGLKYQDDPDLMKLCSSEVVFLNRIARHIIMKNPIIAPILDLSIAASDGKYMDAYSEHADERDVPEMVFITPEATLELEPMVHPDVIAGVYFEEFFIDPFRLCLLQAIDAKNHSAEIKTYCEVIGFEKTEQEIQSVLYYNRLTGQSEKA
ncbi:MAG: FAD-dependent oxidoreductase, partial [Candidatus Thorarchaeota archaeon]